MKDNKKYLAVLLLLGGIWYFNKDKKVKTIASTTPLDPIQGCTDDTALNYDSTATVDDGLCEYEAATPDVIGCMDSEATNYNSLANTELDGSCQYELPDPIVMGCMDSEADNYNEMATDDNGSCTYICDDMDLDGICDDDEVAGCTDATATNYNPSATDDNGSCQYELPDPNVMGCLDSEANNYNPMANINDNSCQYDEVIEEVVGCTEPEADNYNPLATIDDENCIYSVVGCTDSAACNYDSAATADDNSCVFAEENYDCDGNCLNDADGDGICDPYEVSGCTDPTSITYNSAATDDDGSCQYFQLGCTNPNAENYDADATEDDGSCIVAVSPAEINVINYIVDVLIQSYENDGDDEVDAASWGWFEALIYLAPFYDFTAIAEGLGINDCNGSNIGTYSSYDTNVPSYGGQCNFIESLTTEGGSNVIDDLLDDDFTDWGSIFIPTIPLSEQPEEWTNDEGCYVHPNSVVYTGICVGFGASFMLFNTNGQAGTYSYTWQDWVDEYNNWMATGDFNPYVSYGDRSTSNSNTSQNSIVTAKRAEVDSNI